MKRLYIIPAVVVSLAGGEARADGVLCTLGASAANYVPLADQPAPPAVTRDVKKLASSLCPKGCGKIDIFKNQTVSSVVSVRAGDHQTIVYNGTFLEMLGKSYGPGAAMGILAHEIGHHVDSVVPPPEWFGAAWGSELRADGWAGCALARTQAKPAELRAALQALAVYPSPAHPAWSLRAEALQKGFSGCGGGTLAALEEKKADSPRGCTEDSECKAGRACYDGRCQERSARPSSCAKDVDCPGSEVCNAAGKCQLPQAAGSEDPAASERATSGGPQCRDRCGDAQKTCSGQAAASLRACKSSLVANPRYKECSCPRWPTGRTDCYQFCKDTYDKAKECEASHEAVGTACLSVAARCVSDCR